MSTTAQPPSGTSSSSPEEGAAPAGQKKLTAKQQRIYDMKVAGKTRAEIAAEVGISIPVVSKTLVVCYKKLGLEPGKRPSGVGIENKKPEVAAAAIVAASDPWLDTWKEKLNEANRLLKEAGLPDKVSEAVFKRLRVKYAGATYAAKDLRTADIVEMMGKKIDMCAFYLDDKVLSEASARDLMLGMTALIEKRQLLRGEPTAIISDAERAKLHELLPMAIAEAKRRGLTVDGQVTEKSVERA